MLSVDEKFCGGMAVDFPFAVFRLSFVITRRSDCGDDKRQPENGESNRLKILPALPTSFSVPSVSSVATRPNENRSSGCDSDRWRVDF
jgi:outer membrane translocation and assembly module TamA